MKSTGIVRKVDELGRIVLPIEMRRTLGIGEKDPLEMYTEKDAIILRKYSPSCVFCGSIEGNIEYKGKYSLQGTTQGRYLTGGVPPVRFSM